MKHQSLRRGSSTKATSRHARAHDVEIASEEIKKTSELSLSDII